MDTSLYSVFASADEVREDRERRALCNGYGEYLRQFSWNWFFTLTADDPKSPDQMRTMFQRFVRSVERCAQQRIGWFFVIECASGDHVHIHGLLRVPPKFSIESLGKRWKHGVKQFAAYDPTRDAAFYIVKWMGDECRLIDFGFMPWSKRP